MKTTWNQIHPTGSDTKGQYTVVNAIHLEDTDPMPWGKHKGVPMADVPADYLFWLWTEKGKKLNRACEVADYIRRNLAALQQEYPDGIW